MQIGSREYASNFGTFLILINCTWSTYNKTASGLTMYLQIKPKFTVCLALLNKCISKVNLYYLHRFKEGSSWYRWSQMSDKKVFQDKHIAAYPCANKYQVVSVKKQGASTERWKFILHVNLQQKATKISLVESLFCYIL